MSSRADRLRFRVGLVWGDLLRHPQPLLPLHSDRVFNYRNHPQFTPRPPRGRAFERWSIFSVFWGDLQGGFAFWGVLPRSLAWSLHPGICSHAVSHPGSEGKG